MLTIISSIAALVAVLVVPGFLCFLATSTCFEWQLRTGWTPMLHTGETIDDRRPKLRHCLIWWPLFFPVAIIWALMLSIQSIFNRTR